MEILTTDIMQWLGNLFWPFLRIGAAFAAAPVFGARTIPVRARIILAILVTLVIQVSLPEMPPLDPFTAAGMALVVQQLVIGLTMGFILQISFATVVMAGQVIATTMGLGFASAIDPQNGIQVTMLGQFYIIVATLLFLAIDGHLLFLQVIVDTFVLLPVGNLALSPEIFFNAVGFASRMFLWATILALPAITGVLLVNLGFGVMTKAAPQLNIFSLGFPMAIIAGFLLMLLAIPGFIPVLSEFFMESLVFTQGLLI